MVDQMVASERVDPVVIAGEVCGRDGDELPVPGAPGHCGRPVEQVGSLQLDQSRSHEDNWIVAGFGAKEDDARGARVATNELSDQPVGLGGGHTNSLDPAADATLTRS